MGGGKHVSFFFVPVIGLVAGLVVTFAVVVISGLGAILAYGLFGFEHAPPSSRALAFIFSFTFTTVVCVGWISWLIDKARQGNRHEQ